MDDLRSASNSVHETVTKALVNKDSESLASVFGEDGAIAVPTGQVIRGRSTIRSMAALMLMTWGGGDLQITRDSLQLKDSTGYEIGRFVFRRAVKDQPDQTWSGSYTAVWGTEAGAWKISRVNGLMNPPRPRTQKTDGR